MESSCRVVRRVGTLKDYMPIEPVLTRYDFPSPDLAAALQRVAEAHGVQEVYWDIWGNQHRPGPEIQRAILESMAVDASTVETLDAALRDWLRRERLAPLPVCVVSTESEPWAPVSLPAGAGGEATLTVELEEGGRLSVTAPVEELAEIETVVVDGAAWVRRRMRLPEGLPFGYHRAELMAQGIASACPLIHCPARVYRPEAITEDRRLAGIAISLYGLRSERNWGAGDFGDLERFTGWARREAGASFVALNPLHALANRSPYNTSPYLPASTFYRNFLYLDIEAVPEYKVSGLAQRMRAQAEERIVALRSAELVDYEGVARLKRVFLQVLYREFLRGGAERRGEFDRFRRKEGRLLERFAVYSALDEYLHRRDRNLWIWPDWPAHYQDPDSPEVAEFARVHWQRVEFWQYVYWLVDGQVAAAQARAVEAGMSIGLYHDLALATDRCGSDLWAHPATMRTAAASARPRTIFPPRARTGPSRLRMPITTAPAVISSSPPPSATTAATAAPSALTMSCASSASTGFHRAGAQPKAPSCANAGVTCLASSPWRATATA
jgi:4-alpha-glucanotransferase